MIFNRIIQFVVLLFVQALVLNHVHLFNVATPLLYVSLAFSFPRNYPRWATLLWCFCMGLCVDIFSNTPGVAAGAMTVVGLLQPYLIQLYIPRDAADDFTMKFSTVGVNSFISYCAILVLTFCLLFFTLEAFNFFNWFQWLLCIVTSTLLTLLLTLVIENLFRK